MNKAAPVIGLLLLASSTTFSQRYRMDAAAKTNMFSKIQEYESQKSINQGMFDVKYYGLDIQVDPTKGTVSGSVTVTAKVVGDSINQMDLNLAQNMTVQAVTIAGNPVSFTRPANMVTISLNRKYTKGEVVSASIVYGGTPSDNFWFTMWNGQWLTSSLSEPYGARNWWPCKDYPSDKADSADIRVRVPSNMVVASNGTLRAVLDSGTTKTYCWEERYPIASYLISVAIHPYTTSSDYYRYSPADSMEVKYYVLPGHEAQAAPYNAKTVNMIRIFSEMFGEYPFVKEKYGHAEALVGSSMEHQTCTTITTWAPNWAEVNIAHELSHQWWGDMITCQDFHHIWLNEGFATYSADLYFERVYGRQFFINTLLQYAYYGEGTIYVYDTTNVKVFFNENLSYNKAEWVLHMLRHVVGDSTFFTILRTYYADGRYQYGTATTENFRDVCEQVSGKNLHQFFQQWIYGEKYPAYTYSWNSVPDTNGGYLASISLSQTTGTTNPAFFVMPIDFKISNLGWDTTVVLLGNAPSQSFRVHTSHQPSMVELDPENWILRTAILTDVASHQSFPEELKLEQNYPNPFNPSTTIKFELPRSLQVNLTVFDILGREVAALVNEKKDAGVHEVKFDGSNLASGVYFYRLQAGDFVQAKKLVILR